MFIGISSLKSKSKIDFSCTMAACFQGVISVYYFIKHRLARKKGADIQIQFFIRTVLQITAASVHQALFASPPVVASP